MLLRDLRGRALARERQRAETLRLALEIGRAVLRVVSDDTRTETVGMLLNLRGRISHSPTMPMAARKRGEHHLGINVWSSGDAADVPPAAIVVQPGP